MSIVLKCIKFMLDKNADELRLISGKPPAVKIDGGLKAISANPIPASEIASFMVTRMSVPESSLMSEETEEFEFDPGDGPLQVTKRLSNNILSLQIFPQRDEPAAFADEGAGEEPAPQEVARVQLTKMAVKEGEPRLDRLFRIMIEAGASDLHLSTNAPPYLRVDGEMKPLNEKPFDSDSLRELLYEMTPKKNQTQFEEKWDTDFAYEIEGLARFRCNLFMDRFGCGAVFRQIPTTIMSCDELGLSKEIQRLCYLTKGLVLVTGPTGSGKSTTLAALVDHINNNRNDHIITIEDPIEFVHPNKKCLVNQREVGEHTLGFKTALRAALREDPDIVLVGEMRDLETIGIAIETAETGHLVFGTLHTTTAVSTVDRIIDQFPSDQQEQIRVMLSESLRGVVSQTLCKKIKGGRVAALEVMLYNRAVANLIREGKTYQIPSIIQTAKKDGMISLNDSLANLVNTRQITADEAYMKAIDKDGIRQSLDGKGLTIK